MSGLFTHTSLAAFLTKPTPKQALGPFFPDDGDEVDTIRENPDSNLSISQANDQDLTFVKGRKGTALEADTTIKVTRGRIAFHTPKPARSFIEPTTNISNIGERPPPTSKENIGLKPSCQDFIP
jgi:hypothetical protein